MSEEQACDVCGGEGYYPIYNSRGSHVYNISCPECFGSGKFVVEAKPEEPSDLPPPSTAASIKSMDELRAYLFNRGA